MNEIRSFKDVYLHIGEMDFQADEDLLVALLKFALSIPMSDLEQARPASGGGQQGAREGGGRRGGSEPWWMLVT
jgi:hypothetical protein